MELRPQFQSQSLVELYALDCHLSFGRFHFEDDCGSYVPEEMRENRCSNPMSAHLWNDGKMFEVHDCPKVPKCYECQQAAFVAGIKCPHHREYRFFVGKQ